MSIRWKTEGRATDAERSASTSRRRSTIPTAGPHIGTAFEKIGADVQARFRRMEGYAVHFLMGNDENTIKVSQAAEELGLAPKPYVDDMARQFQEVWSGARDLQRRLHPDERGAAPRRLPEVHPGGPRRGRHLQEGVQRPSTATAARRSRPRRSSSTAGVPNHPNRTLREVEEENYFFRLSAFGDRLLAHYEAHPDFIQPESRRNEIVSLVEVGPAGRLDHPQGVHLGHPRPVRPRADDLRLVRRPPELHHRDRLRHRRGPVPSRSGRPMSTSSARTSPGSTAPSGRRCCMSAGLPLPRQVFGHGFVYRKARGRRSRRSASAWATSSTRWTSSRGSRPRRSGYYFMSQCPFGGDGKFTVRAVRRGLQRRPRR